ncbi:GNAT family N-acetyltransferase [Ideonella sp. DXS29W]|uniref:GNAT family N-acetyltransferase n=1 Tax=Ideonella lacteola TaxID=2984193 RepID=A0ABU9BU87_9BURK
MRVKDFRPGWRTDFLLHRVGGEVIERDDCVVVRTPSNEGFYWGNCLMIPETPSNADLPYWLRRFEEEVALGRPGVRHVAIAVNSAVPDPGVVSAWLDAGFEFVETATLRLRPDQLRSWPAPELQPAPQLRPIDFDREIPRFVALQSADPQGHEPEGYRRFREAQMHRFAQVHAAGLGDWFGLWCGDELVADCGLLRDGALGRFQNVLVHPRWRRRGLCRALVQAVSRWGFERWGLTELIMCADPDDVAIRIYQSVGFEVFDHEWGLQRNPLEDEGARRSVRLASAGGAA